MFLCQKVSYKTLFQHRLQKKGKSSKDEKSTKSAKKEVMKRRASKFFVLLFSVVCVCACAFVARLLSSVITVSGNGISQATVFQGFEVYAVSLGQYSSKSQAETSSESITKKGGAGFIYEKDNMYYVLASVYEKENDAKLVQENLSSSGISSKIIKMGIDGVDFSSVSSSAQKKAFTSALLALKSAYVSLYDISVSLDTKTYDEAKARIEIIGVKGDLEKSVENISKGSSSVDGIYYQMIKNTFDEIVDSLNDLKNYQQQNDVSLSSKIKFTYINLIDEIDSLSNLLNNNV